MVASGRESSRCSRHNGDARATARFTTNDCTGYKLMQSGLLPGGLRLYLRPCGDVAQLGERRVRNAEVEGSIPFVSTRCPLPTTLRRRFHFHRLNAARLRSRRTATESARLCE